MGGPPPGGHVAALDGYRALAVGLVVVHHFSMILPGPLPRPLLNLAENGWAGVDLFFVLSGFLITGILLRTAGRPRWLRNFWIRRSLRILPLYYLLLLIFVVPAALVGRPLMFPPWAGFAFLTNFWISDAPQIDLGLVVLWSLAVEEQFYWVWPWVVRHAGRALPVVFVAMIVVAPALRGAWVSSDVGAVYFHTWSRMDALAWGALGAWLAHRGRVDLLDRCGAVAPYAALLLVALAAAFPWPRATWTFATFGYAGLSVVSLVMVLGLASGRVTALSRLFEGAALRHVGKVSFGLYLVHNWVLIALKRPLGAVAAAGPVPVTLGVHALAGLLAVGIATLVWRTIEEPILGWKDRLAPSS